MLAKILQYCEKEPTAIIGSIVTDFGSNVLLPTHKSDLWVIEACELAYRIAAPVVLIAILIAVVGKR